jgi:putative ABC transport system permease protein
VIGLVIGGLAGLAAIGAAGFLAVTLVRVLAVLAIQWRDLFSFDRWTEVLATIRRNKLRTALTMISVAWGIFVLVFLLGLGHGLDNGLRTAFAREAANSVQITAAKTSVPYNGYDVGRKITFENRDYDRAIGVKLPGVGAPGVDRLTGQYYIRGGAYGGGEMITRRNGKANAFQISAVHPDALFLYTHSMAGGRFLNVLDIVQRRKAAVLGRAAKNFLFADENPIGEWINIAGVPFQVVGVFFDESGPDQERQIYVPVSTAQLAYNGADRLGSLKFTVGDANGAQAKEITERVVAQLAERHKFSPTDPQAVRIQNNVEQFERFSKLFWMISTFVVVIGLGTLAAGVVGVSNIMMIAVKERTKEIGVRKALGATPNSIIAMVTQEAVFLTGLAGLVGLSAGVALLGVTSRVVDSEFIRNPSINLGVGVAAAIGLVVAGALAGFFPARAAARVNPIAALRDQ